MERERVRRKRKEMGMANIKTKEASIRPTE